MSTIVTNPRAKYKLVFITCLVAASTKSKFGAQRIYNIENNTKIWGRRKEEVENSKQSSWRGINLTHRTIINKGQLILLSLNRNRSQNNWLESNFHNFRLFSFRKRNEFQLFKSHRESASIDFNVVAEKPPKLRE